MIRLFGRSCAKNSRAYSNVSCAFSNGGFQIVRHAHGQGIKINSLASKAFKFASYRAKCCTLLLK